MDILYEIMIWYFDIEVYPFLIPPHFSFHYYYSRLSFFLSSLSFSLPILVLAPLEEEISKILSQIQLARFWFGNLAC